MRATMALLVWRSGVALASRRDRVVAQMAFGVRLPVARSDRIARRLRRRSSRSTPAFLAGRGAITAPSSHSGVRSGGWASRPLLATVPSNSRPASSLSASLRDILEQGDDKKSPTDQRPPSPPAAAPSPPAAPIQSDEAAVEKGGKMGGMMRVPPGAPPLSTTIGGRTITTTSKTPSSSLTTLDSTAKPYVQPIVSVSDAYDSGNGEFVALKIVDGEEDDCDVHVAVKIRPDPYTALEEKRHFQYFSFRSTLNADSPAARGIFSGKKSLRVKYIVQNAGEASYADAFKGYSTFVTTKMTPFEPDAWERVGDASYERDRLTWTHVHELGEEGSATAYFAYFPPYSQERHLGLIAKCAEAKGATVESLGSTIEGREIEMVTVGTGLRTCWIIHRQHPGESMAEFYAEGLLTRLLGLDDKWDKVAEKARELYTFHIVPNINPDGSFRGYLRTNAAGQNLNREWCPSPAPSSMADDDAGDDAKEEKMYEAPTLERSPEVYHLLRRMDRTGCDAFLDVHGDEELPFNFLAGVEGMSVWGKRLESLHGAFLASYGRANGDMQSRISYEPDGPGEGWPHIGGNQIAERYDCLAGTLEMPFKELWSDTTGEGDGDQIGWGPERARRLGASVLDALCYVSPYLRDAGEFWEDLPEEDAYVRPTDKY